MLIQWHPPPLSITPPSSLDGLGVVCNNTTPFFMGTSVNCLFTRDPKQLRWGQPLLRHRFLLLQNRHTVHPAHKPRAQIPTYFIYAAVFRAALPRLMRLLLVLLLPWMACMQALHRYMDVTY